MYFLQTRSRWNVPLALLVISVIIALVFPNYAWATTDDQKQTASEEEIASAFMNGDIKTELSVEEQPEGEASPLSAFNKRIKTLYGITQYDTAAKEALYAYSLSTTVIVASGESYVDALSATSLAGALGCPILLTSKTTLPDATANALKSLGCKKVVVVGGNAVVSDAVYDKLAAFGSAERLFGVSQYDTQLKIYQYGKERSLWDPQGRVIIASGSTAPGRFADALSVSPLAFKVKAPIFLVDDSGSLPDTSALTLLSGGFNQAIIAGGTVVVSEETAGFAEAATLSSLGVGNVVRRCGSTKYETSASVAEWAVEAGILKWDGAAIATGSSPYDALAGSVVQGKEGSVLILADVGETYTTDILVSRSVSTYKYFGGSALFNNVFKVQLAYAMNIPLYEIEGLVVYLDAGHGWDSSNNDVMDWGASGSGYNEFTLTKELANNVANVLRDTYKVTTYVNDDGGYYAYRQAEAYAMNAGVLVSIHFNSTGTGRASGTESYIHSYNAASGSSRLQDKTHSALVSGLGLSDRGKKDEEFAVCGGRVPGVLLEIAFIDNSNDMNTYNAKKSAVASKIASGIAD